MNEEKCNADDWWEHCHVGVVERLTEASRRDRLVLYREVCGKKINVYLQFSHFLLLLLSFCLFFGLSNPAQLISCGSDCLLEGLALHLQPCSQVGLQLSSLASLSETTTTNPTNLQFDLYLYILTQQRWLTLCHGRHQSRKGTSSYMMNFFSFLFLLTISERSQM